MSPKLLLPAVLAAFSLLIMALFAPSPEPLVRPAEAALDCSNTFLLRVDLFDLERTELVDLPGASVTIDPDPRDGLSTRIYVDNGPFDDNPALGRIDEDEACEVTAMAGAPTAYSVSVDDLPIGCDLISASPATTPLMANETLTFDIDGCPGVEGISITPASTFLGCGQSTAVEVEIDPDDGPIPDGSIVGLTASIGSVTPQVDGTLDGKAFFTYTAPSSTSGTATLTAEIFGQIASTTLTVSCNVAPAQIGFPSVTCGATATATFDWTAVQGASTMFLDLTLFDNGFAGGTFLGIQVDPNATEATLDGVAMGLPHYWRVNALTAEGWVTSGTGAFVACGGPELRGTSYTCTGGGTASVTFFYSPPSPSGQANWLDISTIDGSFAEGTFLGSGSFPFYGSSFTWNGILADVTHYWRYNTLFSVGWDPSSTGTFYADC